MQASVEVNKKKEEVKSDLKIASAKGGSKINEIQHMLKNNLDTQAKQANMAVQSAVDKVKIEGEKKDLEKSKEQV